LVDYKRRCENWLHTFREWTVPRSEAPETFIFWTGLFTLAAALRRKVQVPKEILGSWSASPNLYVIFVAPPAKARKSTTANYTEALLEDIPGITLASSSMTQASLMKKLSETDDSSVTIVSHEFATLILKSGMDMFDFLTDLFDGKKSVSAETVGRGFEFAHKPCVNLLAATTPEWISTGMPESVIGGGFASRVIFIYENAVRKRQLIYRGKLDHGKLAELKEMLKEDLHHIATSIEGDFDLDPEAESFIETWYQSSADKLPTDQYKLHGYYERKPAHVLKVAQLLHVARSDELVLRKEDFIAAIDILRGIEKNLPLVFSLVGKNKYTVDIGRIRDVVREKGRVPRKELFSQFYHAANPTQLDELIAALIIMGDIGSDIDDKGVLSYIYKGTN
jgi:hypothetical protein